MKAVHIPGIYNVIEKDERGRASYMSVLQPEMVFLVLQGRVRIQQDMIFIQACPVRGMRELANVLTVDEKRKVCSASKASYYV